MSLPSVLVLGGGPDSEREVSLESSRGVADALQRAGHVVRREVIDTLTPSALRALQGDVVFPVLHGPWGEGGPLQDLLEASGRPFVGCGARAARIAMDKIATKLAAASAGVATLPGGVLNTRDHEPSVGLPCVVKPIHEGSSVGVHICTTRERWEQARAAVIADRGVHPDRAYMIEQAALGGRELAIGVLDGVALPIIEIKPAVEFYDYQAKYQRDDTKYVVHPVLPGGLSQDLPARALAVAKAIGVRHLSRVDFMIDQAGAAWLLEVNTLPGFTSHSLFPMAAQHVGLDFPALTSRLVQLALRDAR
jgi:D-alanine-D-alanine ligase